MSNESLSEDEFCALTDRVVAALDASANLPLYSVEYPAPKWKPGRIGVLLRFRTEAASRVAYDAIDRAGLPSEPTTDGWRERLVLGEAAAKARGWTVGARGAGGGGHTKQSYADAMASAGADRKAWHRKADEKGSAS